MSWRGYFQEFFDKDARRSDSSGSSDSNDDNVSIKDKGIIILSDLSQSGTCLTCLKIKTIITGCDPVVVIDTKVIIPSDH